MKVFGADNISILNKVNGNQKKTEGASGDFSCKIKQKIECNTRNLSFSQCDKVKICPTEGYILKAKVDCGRVYVEQKMEDGTIKGYEVNPSKVPGDTKDPIERTALEALEQNRSRKEERMAVSGIGGLDFVSEEVLRKLFEDREDS